MVARKKIKLKRLGKAIQKRDIVYRSVLEKRATTSELVAKKIFDSIKLRYRFQKSFWKLTGKYKGYHCIVDFYIPSLHLAIEIDGGYHTLPEQKRKDNFKDKWLKKYRKVMMLRIENSEARQVMERIDELLNETKNKKYNRNYKYWNNKYKAYSKNAIQS